MKRPFFLFLLLLLISCNVPPVGKKSDESRSRSPVILISIDGFRWDYPEKASTPNLDFLINNGVRAEWLISCFPTKTFPNHYTVVTGLYPENHGIVANNMFDPETGEYFKLSLPEAIHDPDWWGGEPIWVTAEEQGVVAASYFWPGSSTEIQGTLPTYWYEYDGGVANETRVQQVLQWLDLPEPDRPSFITTYFSTLDDAGHDYGPESPEVVQAIAYIDTVIGLLLDGLRERDLIGKVNIIIVSDHGMTEISEERVIFLDDYIDLSDAEVVDWNPVAAINPKDGQEQAVYRQLHGAHPHLQVYKKDDIPARWHYRDHPHIPKILAVADKGWSIISREEYGRNPHYVTGGNHGFDNALQSMGAFFVGSGPAFKSGVTVKPFMNIHLYELMAEILKLEPAKNDGHLDSVKVVLR